MLAFLSVMFYDIFYFRISREQKSLRTSHFCPPPPPGALFLSHPRRAREEVTPRDVNNIIFYSRIIIHSVTSASENVFTNLRCSGGLSARSSWERQCVIVEHNFIIASFNPVCLWLLLCRLLVPDKTDKSFPINLFSFFSRKKLFRQNFEHFLLSTLFFVCCVRVEAAKPEKQFGLTIFSWRGKSSLSRKL